MKIETKLVVGEQKLSHRYYEEKVIQEAIDAIEYPLYLDGDVHNLEPNMASLCGKITKMWIENGVVWAEKESILTEYSKIVDDMPEHTYSYIVVGTGLISPDLNISDFVIEKVSVYPEYTQSKG